MQDVSTVKKNNDESFSRKRGRSIWWKLHQFAGLQFSLFLSFVFITGTFAVMSHEIDWLLRPIMWVSPTPENERVSLGTAVDRVQAIFPRAIISAIYTPIHSAAPFDIVVTDRGKRKHIYVHPKTGEFLGEGSWFNVHRFLRDSHRRIMIFKTYKGVRIGILLVCLSSLYLLVSLITSLWVYKKWWRGFFRLPKGKGLRAYVGDLHRWVGIWSLWFVMVMTYTGLWYLQAELISYPPYPRQHLADDLLKANREKLSLGNALDLAIANSETIHSEFQPSHVLMQDQETETPIFEIQGHTEKALLVDPRGNSVWANAETGTLLASRDASTFDIVDRLYVANNPLHFGTFAGYITKWLYFLFGLLLSGLSITGVLIYVSRLAIHEKKSLGVKYFLKNSWKGMGHARWPALLLTLLSFIAFPTIFL
tara:strand:- start:1032 stop:2297 length:1266 start_codon:yes stop_codon:yes gene_type:complete